MGEPGSMTMFRGASGLHNDFNGLLLEGTMRCGCGDPECPLRHTWISMEANIIGWWVTQNLDVLRTLIAEHEEEMVDNADRSVDELLGRIREEKGSPPPDEE